jgi:hypothetical protein
MEAPTRYTIMMGGSDATLGSFSCAETAGGT